MARIEALEQEHVSANRVHAEVDDLGRTWLNTGSLPADRAERFLTLVHELRDVYRTHIAVEDQEVLPAAAAALSPSDRKAIGTEMASRRGADFL
jgi:hemerythrin-like domain-containing protein